MEYSLKRLWRTLAGSRTPQAVERRTESRLPAHGPARIRLDVEGATTEMVSLLGVSGHGLSFRSSQSIAPQQKILVETEKHQFEAVVRHVEPDGQEFVVGAEILTSNGQPLPTGPATEQVVDEP